MASETWGNMWSVSDPPTWSYSGFLAVGGRGVFRAGGGLKVTSGERSVEL